MTAIAQIRTPTGAGDDRQDFHHLLPHLRLGKVSGEVFSKAHLATIPLDYDIREQRQEVEGNAAEKLREGRAKGVPTHDKEVRGEEGSQHLLRTSKRAGQGKNNQGKGQLNVQAGREAEKAETVKKARARKRRVK